MASDRMRILIVSDDAQIITEATELVVLGFNADVTVVGTIEEAAVASASGAFDAILAAETLPDGEGIDLLHPEGKGRTCASPLFLLAGKPDAEHALAAIRLGVVEVFTRPFKREQSVPVMRRAILRRRERQFQDNRSRRLRRLSSRLIRDRRELRQRVDLVCRDVVQAYRRLVDKAVRNGDPREMTDPGNRISSLDPNP